MALSALFLCFDVCESVLAGEVDSTLTVYLRYLDYYLVANGYDVLYLLNTLLVKLGDVNEAVHTWYYLYECAEFHDAYYLAAVDSAYLGAVSNCVNYLESLACVLTVDSADEYVALVVDVYLYVAVCGYLLDDLSAAADDLAYLLYG